MKVKKPLHNTVLKSKYYKLCDRFGKSIAEIPAEDVNQAFSHGRKQYGKIVRSCHYTETK